MRKAEILAMAAFACLSMLACSVNSPITIADGSTVEGSRTTVNGGVFIGENCVVKGSCRTVNGRVSVGTKSQVKSLKTVNGSISIDDEVVIDGDLEAVNGSISLGQRTVLTGAIDTVNGGLDIGEGSVITGTARTVNGGIGLFSTELDGDLVTTNGHITLEGSSRVTGDIHIRGKSRDQTKPIRITISDTSTVEGNIVIDDPGREVVLMLEDEGSIVGSTGSAKLEEEPTPAEGDAEAEIAK